MATDGCIFGAGGGPRVPPVVAMLPPWPALAAVLALSGLLACCCVLAELVWRVLETALSWRAGRPTRRRPQRPAGSRRPAPVPPAGPSARSPAPAMAPPEEATPAGRTACPPAVLQYAEQLVRDVITCAVRGLRGDEGEVRPRRHVSPRAPRDGTCSALPSVSAALPEPEPEPEPSGVGDGVSADRLAGPAECEPPSGGAVDPAGGAGTEPCDLRRPECVTESRADAATSSPLRSSCCGLALLSDGVDVSDGPVPDPGLAASARSWKAASTGELHQLMACSAAAGRPEVSPAFPAVSGECPPAAAQTPQDCPQTAVVAVSADCAAVSIDRVPPPRPPAPVRSQPAGPPQRPPPPTAVIPRCCADAYGRPQRPPERASAAAAAALDPASSASEPFDSCAGSNGSPSGEDRPAAGGEPAAVSCTQPAPPPEPASEAASTDCDLLDVDELSLDQELAQVVSSAGRRLRDDVLDEILATAGRYGPAQPRPVLAA